jgi:TonB family protein
MYSAAGDGKRFGSEMHGPWAHAFAPLFCAVGLHALVVIVILLFGVSYPGSREYVVSLVSETPTVTAGKAEQKEVVRRAAEPVKSARTPVPQATPEAPAHNASPLADTSEKQAVKPDAAPGSSQGVVSRVSHSGVADRRDERPAVIVDFGSPSGPGFIYRAHPVYPAEARRFSVEGKVVLRLHFDRNGIVQRIEVVEDPGYGFSQSAIEGVKKSKFRPARRDGRTIPSIALLPVKFVLDTGESR